MTTHEPDNNTPHDLVPHLVPDLVPDRPRAHCETTSSPVPSSSIGDEVSEPSPPRPTTSSQHQDDHPHQHPATTVSNPMRSGGDVVPHAADLDDLIGDIRATWGPFARDAEEVIDALLGQRDSIAANRNALALKLADLRAEHVRLRAGVTALAEGTCLGCFSSDHPCGSPTCALREELRELLMSTTAEGSASGELHDHPDDDRDGEDHERGEEAEDDQPLEALGVADQGVHGASVGAGPDADPRFAGGWINSSVRSAAYAPTDRDALIHARWHRALDDITAEPDGPIKDHLLQHGRRLQAEALREVAADMEGGEHHCFRPQGCVECGRQKEREGRAHWLRARADRIEAGA